MLSVRRATVQSAKPLLRALYSSQPPVESAETQAPTTTPEPSLERYPLPRVQSPVFKKALEAARSQTKTLNAVVVSSGFMEKTVKVRVGKQKWNAFIGKNFKKAHHLLVHDPASSLRTGDIISVSPNWRASKTVNHVVKEILAPFGVPIDQRPPVPTLEERVAMRHKRNWERKIRKSPEVLKGWEGYKRWKGMQRAIADGRDRGGKIERVAEGVKNMSAS